MPVLPFTTDIDLETFARAFLRQQITRFRKDIAVCLTPDAQGSHAYFPALMACIGFVDLLSGLHAGKLEYHGLKELKSYASKFLGPDYDHDRLEILYEFLRHKVAHLAQPYAVFDTHSKASLKSKPRRFITWTIMASRKRPSIEIRKVSTTQIIGSPTPWDVYYDHRIYVSVRTFASDIVKSIHGPCGYLRDLQKNATSRMHFRQCMNHYFPKL